MHPGYMRSFLHKSSIAHAELAGDKLRFHNSSTLPDPFCRHKVLEVQSLNGTPFSLQPWSVVSKGSSSSALLPSLGKVKNDLLQRKSICFATSHLLKTKLSSNEIPITLEREGR